MKSHFVPALLSVLVAPMAPLASAAFVQVWQLGVDNDSQGEFSQETGSNVAPGAVTPVNAVTPAQAADPAFNLTTHDDDFYFAGTYASPIGVVTNTEPLKALDRALTGDVNGANGDIWDRVHFNLDQASVVGSTELRLTIDLIGLGYWDHGFRHVTNSKHPVEKVEDLKGLKLRLQQIPTAIESFRTLGANVVPLSFTELYTAMETRTVDGQENPLAAIETSKFYEVQKYLSLTGHFYDPLVAIFSKRTWDKLNETERELVRSASLEAQAYERKVSREMDVSSRQALAKHGMQINEVAPEEIERMREQVRPTVEKLVAEYGPALMDEMNAEIAKVRNAQ